MEATAENARKVAAQCVRPVNAYLLARTLAEVTRERVDAVEREVLAECPLTNGLETEHGKPPRDITEPRQVYLCTDEALTQDYFAEVNKRLRERGIKPANMPDEHCPALVAERIQTEASWIIEDAAAKAMGMDFDGKELNHRLLCLGLEKRQKFLDLIIGLVVNAPGYKPPPMPHDKYRTGACAPR